MCARRPRRAGDRPGGRHVGVPAGSQHWLRRDLARRAAPVRSPGSRSPRTRWCAPAPRRRTPRGSASTAMSTATCSMPSTWRRWTRTCSRTRIAQAETAVTVEPGSTSGHWHELLRASGHRLTPQRELVLAAVETLGHATPDEVFAEVRTHSESINLSTVYRTLELLDELGLIRHAHLSDRAPTYHSARGHERRSSGVSRVQDALQHRSAADRSRPGGLGRRTRLHSGLRPPDGVRHLRRLLAEGLSPPRRRPGLPRLVTRETLVR